MCAELEQDFEAGGHQPALVLRELGLRDPKDAAELLLCEVEPPYLPDAATDSRKVEMDFFMLDWSMHYCSKIFSIVLRPRFRVRVLYRIPGVGKANDVLPKTHPACRH